MNNSSIIETNNVESSSDSYATSIFLYLYPVQRAVGMLGLILNIVVMSAILRNYKKLSNPMYLFIVNVAIPDVAELVFMAFDVWNVNTMLKFPTVLYALFRVQITWYLTLFSVLGLSLNRAVAVIFWTYYDTVSYC